MLRTLWLVLMCAVVLALVGAGCGGDDDPEPDSGGDGDTDSDTDTDTDSDSDECASLTITTQSGESSVGVGETIQFVASCGAQDVTATADWLTVDVSIATISNDAADKGLATGVAPGVTNVTATYTPTDGTPVTSESFALTVTDVAVQSIAITPQTHTLVSLTDTQQYTAMCTDVNGNETECSDVVSWASSNGAAATISATGLASAVANGTTTITATLDGIVSNEATLTVAIGQFCTNLEIVSDGDVTTIMAGDDLKFAAYCTFGKNARQQTDVTNDVLWSTSDPQIATISNEPLHQGELASLSEGNVTVSAVYTQPDASTIDDDFALTVEPANLTEITVEPTFAELNFLGTTQAYTAYCTYNNGAGEDCTADVSWSSSVTTVATIDAAGEATAVANGTTIITASQGGIDSNQATLVVDTENVCVEVQIEPASPADLPEGLTQEFKATCIMSGGGTNDVTDLVGWTSSNPEFATIEDTGVAQAQAPGTTTITATFALVTPALSDSVELTVIDPVIDRIEVEPEMTNVADGAQIQLTATVIYTDDTTNIITEVADWTTSDGAIASVDNAGLVTGESLGQATITATYEDHEDTATIHVTNATLVEIDITPPDPSVPAGMEVQFTAFGIYSDGTSSNITTSAEWRSSNTDIATVSNTDHGMATGQAPGGPVTITASAGGVEGTALLTVTDAPPHSLTIEAAQPDNTAGLPMGLVQGFIALIHYTAGPSIDVTTSVTWDSSNESVATISNADGSEGQATGLAMGTTQISATFEGFTSNPIPLVVSTGTIESIDVTTADGAEEGVVPRGYYLNYIATAIYTDGSSVDITDEVTWSSGAEAVATISNADGSRGVARGVDVGTTTITAIDPTSTLSDSASIEVTDNVLVNIELEPFELEIPEGATHQFRLIGHYYPEATHDLTEQATWSVENLDTSNSVGSILNTPGSRGLFEAVTAGIGDLADCESEVIARVGTFTARACVDIYSVEVDFVDVQIDDTHIPVGLTEQARCIVHYADGRTFDITEDATWASQYPSVATVGDVAGNKGVITALSDDPQDQTQITCEFGGSADYEVITVEACPLIEIDVTPSEEVVARGMTQQYTATGNYGNCGPEDITDVVTWGSNNENYATISNVDGSRGLAQVLDTATVGNSTVIQANIGTTIGEATLIVGDACVLEINVIPEVLDLPVDVTQQLEVSALMSDGTVVPPSVFGSYVYWDTEGGHTTIHAEDGILLTRSYTAEGNPDRVVVDLQNEPPYVGCDPDAIGEALVTVNREVLENIVVSPADTTTSRGTQVAYTARGYYSNQTNYDITDRVYWNAAVTSIASFQAYHDGIATADSDNTGTTTVTASLSPGNVQDTRVGSASLTVTGEDLVDVRIELLTIPESCVEAPICEFPGNVHVEFRCVGEFSAGPDQELTNALFSSSLPSALDFPGDVLGRALTGNLDSGEETVTVTCAGAEPDDPSATMDVVVYYAEDFEYEIVPVATDEQPFPMFQGQSAQFYALADWDGDVFNVTELADWHTTTEMAPQPTTLVDDGDNKGLLSAEDGGVDIIYANYSSNGHGKTDGSTVEVSDACVDRIVISPGPREVIAGHTIRYTSEFHLANGTTAPATEDTEWYVGAPYAQKTPEGEAGEFTGLLPGNTSVTAMYRGTNPDYPMCGDGEPGVDHGITFEFAPLTVTNPIIAAVHVACPFLPGDMVPGQHSQCSAYGWFSDNPLGAEPDGNTNYAENWKDITDEEGTTWSLSNGNPTDAVDVNTSDAKGYVIAVKPTQSVDTAAIRASFTDSSSNTEVGDSATFDVLDCEIDSIDVYSCMVNNGTLQDCDDENAGYDSLPAHEFTQAYAAEGTWVETGTSVECATLWITRWADWDTGNNTFATMADSVVTTHLAGQGSNVLIEATYMTVNGNRQLEINNAALDSIAVEPGVEASLWQGQQQRYTATGLYLPGDYERPVTQQCTWTSSEPSVATINDTDDKGLATATNSGTGDQSTIIECEIGGVSANTVLWVHEPCLMEVTVSTGDGHNNYPDEVPVSFVARGLFSNQEERVLLSSGDEETYEVAWSADAPLSWTGFADNHILAMIYDLDELTAGMVTADASGTFTVCEDGEGVGDVEFIIDPSWNLDSITVLANPLYLAKGENDDLTALGNYSREGENRTYDITEAIGEWVASDEDFVIDHGLISYDPSVLLGHAEEWDWNVFGAKPGDVLVSARKGLVHGSAMVHVTDETLVALWPRIVNITIGCGGNYYDEDPSEDCLPRLSEDGLRSVIDVFGIYSDGTVSGSPIDVDSWVSSEPDVITIDNDGAFTTGALPVEGPDELPVTLTASKTADPAVEAAEVVINVTRGAIYQLEIQAEYTTIDLGNNTRWYCHGRQENTEIQFDVTGEVTWSTEDDGVATVENGAANGGLITGEGVGETLIWTHWNPYVSANEAITVVQRQIEYVELLEWDFDRGDWPAPFYGSSPLIPLWFLGVHYNDGGYEELTAWDNQDRLTYVMSTYPDTDEDFYRNCVRMDLFLQNWAEFLYGKQLLHAYGSVIHPDSGERVSCDGHTVRVDACFYDTETGQNFCTYHPYEGETHEVLVTIFEGDLFPF